MIGLPGETVEVRNGQVFINGQELKEDYLDIEHNQEPSRASPRNRLTSIIIS